MFFKSKTTKILLLRKDILDNSKIKPILENLNLSCKIGTNLIIKGKNGSGKTSLLLNLNKLLGYITSIPKKTNLNDFFCYNNILNRYYHNINKLIKFKVLSHNINLLSYGYKKYYYLLINWCLKKQIYLFDEPFNGLDKYFLLQINRIYLHLYTTKAIQLKAYHNKVNTTNFVLLFLD